MYLRKTKLELGALCFGFFWCENKSLTLSHEALPRSVAQWWSSLSRTEYLLNFLRDWFREWERKNLAIPDMCSGLMWLHWEYSHKSLFTQISLSPSHRWITWIRMGSVLWSMLHSEVIWRLSSFWFNVTGQWLASSKGCLRRAMPSNRPSLLQPAWVTLR